MKCNLLLQLYIVYSKNSAEYEENEENKTKVKSFNTLRGIIDIEAKKWRQNKESQNKTSFVSDSRISNNSMITEYKKGNDTSRKSYARKSKELTSKAKDLIEKVEAMTSYHYNSLME